jgi:hypothetical protein
MWPRPAGADKVGPTRTPLHRKRERSNRAPEDRDEMAGPETVTWERHGRMASASDILDPRIEAHRLRQVHGDRRKAGLGRGRPVRPCIGEGLGLGRTGPRYHGCADDRRLRNVANVSGPRDPYWAAVWVRNKRRWS